MPGSALRALQKLLCATLTACLPPTRRHSDLPRFMAMKCSFILLRTIRIPYQAGCPLDFYYDRSIYAWGEDHSLLYNLFRNTEVQGTFSNSFYEASVT